MVFFFHFLEEFEVPKHRRSTHSFAVYSIFIQKAIEYLEFVKCKLDTEDSHKRQS